METLEELQARHRTEQRNLQAKVTQKKKQATKKTRKGINAECDELERQLKEKQAEELTLLHSNSVPDITDIPELDGLSDNESPLPRRESTREINAISSDLQKSSISEPAESESGDGQHRKRNRQKERLARRAAEQEAAAIEAEKEAAKLPNWKRQERTAMLKAFKENGLIEKEIQPDGHCLFSAVADQLAQAGIPLGIESERESAESMRYKAVRRTAARYMEGHPEEFAGFLDEPLEVYVSKIRQTAEWGGQLELIALAKCYNIEICVLQDGRTDRFGPGNGDDAKLERIWLAYYHHGYGLGEHYNSLRKAP